MINKCLYYGVIGNRDYIKVRGDKRPFWEFLDEQPDGWLTSLTYRREDLPTSKHMIFDCGAWSYKNEDKPKINYASAIEQYISNAPAGSIIVAPDHMLLEGSDLRYRRWWNSRQAKLFLRECPATHKPMAVVHGNSIEERLLNATKFLDMGYQHLAVGGVAVMAAQKARVSELVFKIREATQGTYLHVLGLTSPPYMLMWDGIGVNSADGSSHFKQAFTGGAFYTFDRKLIKHQASRPGDTISAPMCDCRACRIMRKESIDTRSYGSNESNMGRAAHNLNILMRAHKWNRSALSLV